MIYTTQNLLKSSTYPLVRAIASRLGLRSREQHRKEEWVSQIHDYLLSPALVDELLPTLSPKAQQALFRLAAVETLPTYHFLNEYGPIRYPRQTSSSSSGDSSRDSIAPWRDPKSAAEELYYSGLLFSGDHRTLAKSRIVTLPVEIRDQLFEFRVQSTAKEEPSARASTTNGEPAQSLPTGENPPGLVLLHDLGQLLIFLHSQESNNDPPIKLLHGRWLPPSTLRQLDQRLLNSEPGETIRSHKQCRWQAFLFSLAVITRLIAIQHRSGPRWSDGEATCVLTAYAWHWLTLTPAQQLGQLWERWLYGGIDGGSSNGNQSSAYAHAATGKGANAYPAQPVEDGFAIESDDTHLLRKNYDQPGGHIRSPWLEMVCRYLGGAAQIKSTPSAAAPITAAPITAAPLTAQWLTDQMLSGEAMMTPFFSAWFHSLSDIEAVVYQMLSETFRFWGLVELTGRSDSMVPPIPHEESG